jgi:hypothetical protein
MKKVALVLFGAAALAVLSAAHLSAQVPGEAPMGAPEMWQEDGPGRGGDRGMEPGLMQHRGGNKGMDDRMGGPGMKPGGRAFSASDEETVVGLIKKHDPAFAAGLAGLKGTSPEKYKMVIRMSGKMVLMAKMEKDEAIEKDVVRGISLEYDTKELSRGYDKASDGEKERIKKELDAKVAELFDLRLKGQAVKIQRMEKDLAKLKKNLESRRANKAKIVEERVGQLLGESVGW